MKDLIEQLRSAYDRRGGGLGDAALFAEAADEIERLRGLAGAVTPKETIASIKATLRNLPPQVCSTGEPKGYTGFHPPKRTDVTDG